MYAPGFGSGIFGHFVGALIGAVFGFFVFLIVVGLLFLLVRFLLAGTKAAHLYIAKNSPPAPPRSATPANGPAGAAYAPRPTTVVPTATTPAPVVKPAPTTAAPVVKPATKPRTPKPPTA